MELLEGTESSQTVTLNQQTEQAIVRIPIIERNIERNIEWINITNIETNEAITQNENMKLELIVNDDETEELQITTNMVGEFGLRAMLGCLPNPNEDCFEFTLTVQNIAPSINTNLNDTYEVVAGSEFNLSIDASGTNNTYTWYIGDLEDGEFTEIEGAEGNNYTFTPTLEMNNKYIKCKIANYGNDEVETTAAKIKVYATQNELEDSIYITEGRNLKSITLNNGTTALIGLSPKTKVNDFMSQGNFTLYSSTIEGTINDVIGTNSRIKLIDGQEVIKEYSVVIYGDTDGDGDITAVDALGIIKNKNGKVSFTADAFVEAGRILTTSGIPGAVDALAIIKHKQNSTEYPIEQYK